MQITIDIFSLVLGVFIGAAITLFATVYTLYDDRWSNGFGSGWEAHGKTIEKKGENKDA